MFKPSYGIVSDIHLHNWSAFSSVLKTGENERLMIILDELRNAANTMVKAGCERMYIAGDLFHVRGKITPSVMNPTLKVFRELVKLLEVRIIPGNHDLESDDSCELTNATQALEALGCVIVTKPMYFKDDDVLMIPWVSHLSDLKKQMAYYQSEYEPDAVIIHAPLNGVIPGIPDHGLEAGDLASMGFNKVFCGHYHNRTDFGNGVWSVGATTHQTWGDVNTKAGYLIVSGDTVEPYDSQAPRFVDYNEEISEADAKTLCTDNYVRVRLGEASEKEIQVVRELVKSEYNAKAVMVHAQPKRTTSDRTSSVKAGASLDVSVHDYVKDSNTSVDKAALSRECIAIMAEADTGEDD
jgi:DNA repair exonuclease SbcCD nuclease subunit